MKKEKGVRSFRLQTRISKNTTSKENVDFVIDKLKKGINGSDILREAIDIMRRYEKGDLTNDLDKLIEKIERLNNIEVDSNNKENDRNEKMTEEEKQIADSLDSLANGDFL